MNYQTTDYNPTAPLLEPYNPIKKQWLLRWNKDESLSIEAILEGGKPSLETIKECILAWHNSDIDKEILYGLRWNDMPIWLSQENQTNYKATFDLAMQFQGQAGTLPVTFKFGSDTEPIYHQFSSLEELTNFYLSVIAYIKNTLNNGWIRKDNINWKLYEDAIQAYE